MSHIWTEQREVRLRRSLAKGLTHPEIASLLEVSVNAVAKKVGRLGIQTHRRDPQMPTLVPESEPATEPSVSHYVHHQAVTDYRGGWNYREQCFDNNHLFREAISLAAVW